MNKLLVLLFGLFSINSAIAEIKINDCWVKAPIGEVKTTAAFLTFTNTSNKDVSVVSVDTDAAKMAHFHNIKNENGVISMLAVDELVVPANGKLMLGMGGLHVMLMGLENKLYPGDWIELDFKLSDGSMISREMEVKDPNDKMGM